MLHFVRLKNLPYSTEEVKKRFVLLAEYVLNSFSATSNRDSHQVNTTNGEIEHILERTAAISYTISFFLHALISIQGFCLYFNAQTYRHRQSLNL